jgi:Kef-type K+ transport system membrane component KefB
MHWEAAPPSHCSVRHTGPRKGWHGVDRVTVWISLCAEIAPLLAGLVHRKLLPEVVLLLVAGVLTGPKVLGLASSDEAIELLHELRPGRLFLLAGYEVELKELTGRGGRRNGDLPDLRGLAFAIVWLIGLSGAVNAEVPVAIALTSTALGTLQPILQEAASSAPGSVRS